MTMLYTRSPRDGRPGRNAIEMRALLEQYVREMKIDKERDKHTRHAEDSEEVRRTGSAN